MTSATGYGVATGDRCALCEGQVVLVALEGGCRLECDCDSVAVLS
jgi:hypothetical protein